MLRFLIITCFSLFQLSCNKNEEINIHSGNNLKEVIIVSEEDISGTLQLYIRDIDGSNPIQFTFNSLKSWMPAISPNGDKIAYVQESSISTDIYTINFDGTGNKKITSGGINIAPSWTPDGNMILYTHSPTLNGLIPRRIYMMNPNGGEIEKLIDENGSYEEVVSTISPDGNKVAFASNRSGDEMFEIWVVDIDGANLKKLTSTSYDPVVEANVQQKVPAWSPDGSKIAFWSGVEMNELYQSWSLHDQHIVQSWKIYEIKPDGTNLTSIDFGDDPTWSLDGKYILHPDPMNRDQNPDNKISIKRHLADGTNSITLFKTSHGFGRMDIGLIRTE